MKIKVLLTHNDSREVVYQELNYHRRYIGNPVDYATLLNDCNNENQISRCYPFNNESRTEIQFNIEGMTVKCSFFDNEDRPKGVHNGKHFVNKCICELIEELRTNLSNLYINNINPLKERQAVKFDFEVDCEASTLRAPDKIRIAIIEDLSKIKGIINL